ncbi:hypothetical protein [Gordonia aichiensis]|uniref:hypothetical protein n=1 Tax=Gordonia aichiensis TaxID=36820 RepID=UPI00326684BC
MTDSDPETEHTTSSPASVAGAPDVRFFLPQGPPLPPKRWQRRWKTGIRVGSVVVGAAFVGAAVFAVAQGVNASAHFTASGAVEVDCASRAKPFAPDLRQGAPVRIVDAKSGELYGSAKLDEFRKLGSGICLVGFQMPNVPVAGLYTVEIGDRYRTLASQAALQGGALLS